VVARVFKFNLDLWLEWKPKLEDCNWNPICGGYYVKTMNKNAKSLQFMQNLNVKSNYKIDNTHKWTFQGVWTPIWFSILLNYNERRVCTKKTTLVHTSKITMFVLSYDC
jgi:hypothetical protein